MFQKIKHAYERLLKLNEIKYTRQTRDGGILTQIFLSSSIASSPSTRGYDDGNAIEKVYVTLEDMYLGVPKKIKIVQFETCVACHGSGSKNGRKLNACKICNRRSGAHIPGGKLKDAPRCNACKNTGLKLVDRWTTKKFCDRCMGRMSTKRERIVLLKIQCGDRVGDKVECFNTNGTKSGVVVEVRQLPHETFTRVGDDLVVRKNISLKESLTGYSFALQHVDGRMLRITNKIGSVIANGQIKIVPGIGMPKNKHKSSFGNLVVVFKVVFPSQLGLSTTELTTLKTLLTVHPPVVEQ